MSKLLNVITDDYGIKWLNPPPLGGTNEGDIKTASVIAQTFAKMHHIRFHDELLDLINPILTIFKHESNWYPAEIHCDRITLLQHLDPAPLGGNQQQAINMAKAIALSRRADFLPSIGISLENNRHP